MKRIFNYGLIEYLNEKYQLHRVGMPAVEDNNGYINFIFNGFQHKINGACIYSENKKRYLKISNPYALHRKTIKINTKYLVI